MKYFIDTNILVYANDSRDQKKQTEAINLIKKLIKKGNAVISTQVLGEYAHVALNKLKQKPEIVIRQIKIFENFEVIKQSPDIITRGIELKILYKISFWDACILAAAEISKCNILLSEDLSTGQFYSGIKTINPFIEKIS